jgi:DNA-directed RNA polymerase I subunit RPA2
MAPSTTDTQWDHEYHTVRREKLFRDPPKDHTAYPALQAAVEPHIDSFNGLFRSDGKPGLIDHALADIGTKTFLDGDDRLPPSERNRIDIRFKDVVLYKPQLPPSNKLAKNREIYPAECRERHASYRGRMAATLEYSINGGEPKEFVREMGQVPVMLKVRHTDDHRRFAG